MKEVLKVFIPAMAVLLTSLVFVGGMPDHFRLEKGVPARHQLPLSRIVGEERLRGKLVPGQRDKSKLKTTHSQLKKQMFARKSIFDQEEIGDSADSDPKLFDLLISALGRNEGEDTKRNRQTKPSTKPCYWSLVACY